jgi:hypothetical protein
MAIHGRVIWMFAAIGLLAGAESSHAQTMKPKYAYGNAEYSAPKPNMKPAHQPFAPVQFDHDLQPFAPADISEYGNGPKSRVGFFASYERLYWSISKPALAIVGSQAAEGVYYQDGVLGTVTGPPPLDQSIQTNSFTTGFLNADFAWGNRYDLGYMDDNDRGWLVSILSNLDQNQGQASQGGNILFDDPLGQLLGFTNVDLEFADPFDDDRDQDGIFGRDGIGPVGLVPVLQFFPPDLDDQVKFLPRFDNVLITNRASVNGVELMRTARIPKFHDGSELELMAGVRYLQFKDRFEVTATGGPLDAFFMNTTMQNDIVGPQLGARWSLRRARWTISSEGRFMAGFNFQNGTQYALIDNTNLNDPDNLIRNRPATITRMSARSSSYDEEFSPTAEFRLQASYYLTKAFALKVGYTALYADSVSRASNRIEWALPNYGILQNNTYEYLFTNGLSFGIEINR